METFPSYLWFHSQKQEVTRGQIRWLRRVGDHSCVFSGQKFLHWWSVLVHCCGVWTSCFATVPALLGGDAPSDIAEPPSSNAVYPFGLEEQIFYALALKVTCVGIAWMFTSFNHSFPTFEMKKSIRSLCFSMALSPQAVLRILCISEAGFPHLSKAYCKCIVSPNHLSENHRLHFICTTINTH